MNKGLTDKTCSVIVTKHALEQARKRLGFNSCTLERMACKAYMYGLSCDNTDGILRSFILAKMKLQSEKHDDAILRVYGEILYVFVRNKRTDDLYLLTTYQIPRKMRQYAANAFADKKREA